MSGPYPDLDGVKVMVDGSNDVSGGGIWGNFGADGRQRQANLKQQRSRDYAHARQAGGPSPPEDAPAPGSPLNKRYQNGGENLTGYLPKLPSPPQAQGASSSGNPGAMVASDFALKTEERMFGVENFNRLVWEEISRIRKEEEDARRIIGADVRALSDQISNIQKHSRRDEENFMDLREKVLNNEIARKGLQTDIERQTKQTLDSAMSRLSDLDSRVAQLGNRSQEKLQGVDNIMKITQDKLADQEALLMQVKHDSNLYNNETARRIDMLQSEFESHKNQSKLFQDSELGFNTRNIEYRFQELEQSLTKAVNASNEAQSTVHKLERISQEHHQAAQRSSSAMESRLMAAVESKIEHVLSLVQTQFREVAIKNGSDGHKDSSLLDIAEQTVINDRMLVLEEALRDERAKRTEMEQQLSSLMQSAVGQLSENIENAEIARTSSLHNSSANLRKIVDEFQKGIDDLTENINNVEQVVRSEVKSRMDSEATLSAEMASKHRNLQTAISSVERKLESLPSPSSMAYVTSAPAQQTSGAGTLSYPNHPSPRVVSDSRLSKGLESQSRAIADLEATIESRKKATIQMRSEMENLASKIVFMESKLVEISGRTEEKIRHEFDKFTEVVDSKLEAVMDKTSVSGDNIWDSLKQLQNKLMQEIAVRRQEDEALQRSIGNEKKRTESRLSRLDELLNGESGQRTNDLYRMEQELMDAFRSLDSRLASEEETRGDSVRRLRESLEEQISDEEMARKEAIKTLKKKSDGSSADIGSKLESMEAKLKATAKQMHAKMVDKMGQLEETMMERLLSSGHQTESSLTSMKEDIGRLIEELEKFDSHIKEQLSHLHDENESEHQQMMENIDEKIQSLDMVLYTYLGTSSIHGGKSPRAQLQSSMSGLSVTRKPGSSPTLPQRLLEVEALMERLLGSDVKSYLSHPHTQPAPAPHLHVAPPTPKATGGAGAGEAKVTLDPTASGEPAYPPIYQRVDQVAQSLTAQLTSSYEVALKSLTDKLEGVLGHSLDAGDIGFTPRGTQQSKSQSVSDRVRDVEEALKDLLGRELLSKMKAKRAAADATGEAQDPVCMPVYDHVTHQVDQLRKEIDEASSLVKRECEHKSEADTATAKSSMETSLTSLSESLNGSLGTVNEEVKGLSNQLATMEKYMRIVIGNEMHDEIAFVLSASSSQKQVSSLPDQLEAQLSTMNERIEAMVKESEGKQNALEAALSATQEGDVGNLKNAIGKLEEALDTKSGEILQAVDVLLQQTRQELSTATDDQVKELHDKVKKLLGIGDGTEGKSIHERIGILEKGVRTVIGDDVFSSAVNSSQPPAHAVTNSAPGTTLSPIYVLLNSEIARLRQDLGGLQTDEKGMAQQLSNLARALFGSEQGDKVVQGVLDTGGQPVLAALNQSSEEYGSKLEETRLMMEELHRSVIAVETAMGPAELKQLGGGEATPKSSVPLLKRVGKVEKSLQQTTSALTQNFEMVDKNLEDAFNQIKTGREETTVRVDEMEKVVAALTSTTVNTEQLSELKKAFDEMKDVPQLVNIVHTIGTKLDLIVGETTMRQIEKAINDPAVGFDSVFSLIDKLREKIETENSNSYQQLSKLVEDKGVAIMLDSGTKIEDSKKQLEEHMSSIVAKLHEEMQGNEKMARGELANLSDSMSKVVETSLKSVEEEQKTLSRLVSLGFGADLITTLKSVPEGQLHVSVPAKFEQDIRQTKQEINNQITKITQEVEKVSSNDELEGKLQQALSMLEAELVRMKDEMDKDTAGVLQILASQIEEKIIKTEQRITKNEETVNEYNRVYADNFQALQEAVSKLSG